MKKAFRWGCIALSLFTFGSWALLLHQSRQPWKLVGENEIADDDHTQPGTIDGEQTGKQNAVANSKSHVTPPGEGDGTLDPILVQQQKQKPDTFDIHDARMLFMGPGPVAPKTRHHRKKPKDSSSEEKQESDKNAVSSGDNAAPNAASTATLQPNGGPTITSPVIRTTQTLVERISVPIGTTVNDMTQGIANVTQPRLQSLIYSAPSTVSQMTAADASNISSSPLQTLTTQTLNTVSSPTNTIPPVTSSTSTVASLVTNMTISPTLPTSTISTPSISTATLAPATIATVTTPPPPALAPGFGASSGPVSTISSLLPTSGLTSLSAPTTGLPKGLPRGR